MNQIKTVGIICLFSLFFVKLFAYSPRNFLQQTADIAKVKASLIYDQKWVTYPAYTDRKGWNKFLGDTKQEYIKGGEAQLDYQWQVVKATDYFEFERSGSRSVMETPYGKNTRAIAALFMAEMAEGEGRFLDQLINGVFQACEMTSWVLSAHLNAQRTHRVLPDFREDVIDLSAGYCGSMFSWIYYFLNKEFDKIDPIISIRLRAELERRIIKPFMEEDRFWWMAFHAKSTTMVNNWNPWCNSNVLQCLLLIENNRDRLAEGVYRTMVSVDSFINYSGEDGACEEGSSYWDAAAGKMYDYLQILFDGTNGQISIFDKKMIRDMGEFISRSYVGRGWAVNFADASARANTSNASLIYQYGKAVGSDEMIGFASMQKGSDIPFGVDVFRNLKTLGLRSELAALTLTRKVPFCTWYPQTEFFYLSDNKGNFFAAKGGYNAESHNHNDVGTFVLFQNNVPMLIDVGVGTYTRQTFSNERYSIWTMQSNYHNLPLINGIAQKEGAEYKATQVKADGKKGTFSANIATAYPKHAQVASWIRSYAYVQGVLRISDSFRLKAAVHPNQISFLSWGAVDITSPGKICLVVQGEKAVLEYDSRVFVAKVEAVKLNDQPLIKVWGDQIYRIVLTAKHIVQSGDYFYKIKKV